MLEDADSILVIEADVPWMPGVKAPPPTARIAHIGEDPAFLRYPMRSFPSHLSIAANAGAALRALEAALDRRAAARKARLDKRRAWARQRAAAQRAKAQARLQADAPHISPEYLSRCVGESGGAGRDRLQRVPAAARPLRAARAPAPILR